MIAVKKGDKIWNTYFVPRALRRTLAVGSATVAEVVHTIEYDNCTGYYLLLSYDETDSSDAFGDRHRKDEQKHFWDPHLTAQDAIAAYVRECSAKVRQAEEDLQEALALGASRK